MAIETAGNVGGGLNGNHINGDGGVPTIVLGPGAGTGSSAIITGNDNAFRLQITTGTGPNSTGIVCTITFNTAFAIIPHIVYSFANALAAQLDDDLYVTNITTTNFQLRASGSALTARSVYIYEIIII